MNIHKIILVLSILAVATATPTAKYGGGLKVGYYKYSCPDAEKIVKEVTERYVKHVPSFAPGLLRMHFHDCFVRGCDASILIKPTPAKNDTEVTAIPNSTLRGFEVIDAIKEALEEKCPGVVSCADILSLAARDSIVAINGPWWEVPTGRKDGKISEASEANAEIPSPFSNFTVLKQNFAVKGLNTKDLVVLSGAHTIGVGHCFVVRSRLYNFTGRGDTDPSLSPRYAAWLKTRCINNPKDQTSFVFMDRITPKVFDEKYYTMVTQRRGLFTSDAALLTDSYTKSYVEAQAKSSGATFDKDFAHSMEKLAVLPPPKGAKGEIRKKCGFVNY